MLRLSSSTYLALVLTTAAPVAFADNFIYTTINVPSSVDTPEANGIDNSGQIVGAYDSATMIQGYLDKQGTFTTVSVSGSGGTEPLAINDSGEIVGDSLTNIGGRNAFYTKNGTPTVLNIFGGALAYATGVNDSGQIVGYYSGANAFEGFSYKNGALTSLFVNNSYGTEVNGVDNAGEMVGIYLDNVGATHGFTYQNGTFTDFNVPGDPFATPTGINNNGEIVGYFSGPQAYEGFIDDNGVATTLYVPGSYGTQALGVNDLGQVVGVYFDTEGGHHAFLATPTPEPASLFLAAIAGFLLYARFKFVPSLR